MVSLVFISLLSSLWWTWAFTKNEKSRIKIWKHKVIWSLDVGARCWRIEMGRKMSLEKKIRYKKGDQESDGCQTFGGHQEEPKY